MESAALAADQEVVTVKMAMREHSFDPATVRLTAGQMVRIEITNEGAMPHAFMVGRELTRLTWGPDERPQQDFFDGVDVRRKITYGTLDTTRAADVVVYHGGSAELVFTVPVSKRGDWEIGCLIPGHYESGMRGILVVN